MQTMGVRSTEADTTFRGNDVIFRSPGSRAGWEGRKNIDWRTISNALDDPGITTAELSNLALQIVDRWSPHSRGETNRPVFLFPSEGEFRIAGALQKELSRRKAATHNLGMHLIRFRETAKIISKEHEEKNPEILSRVSRTSLKLIENVVFQDLGYSGTEIDQISGSFVYLYAVATNPNTFTTTLFAIYTNKALARLIEQSMSSSAPIVVAAAEASLLERQWSLTETERGLDERIRCQIEDVLY
ncbi:MAG: hypothetical protein ACHQX1_02350, partial [Candidatus Micrarchaeales archaeon]